MPSTTTKFKIFLASPSDLQEERLSIDEVINELNLTFGRQQNIVLELLKWETHSAPAISKSGPQSVILNDIGNDYDLFIGLLWKKFGTATQKANSGTEEEFLSAYGRFQTNPNSIQILFYFKTTSAPINEIDPEQLQKVMQFKKDLSKNKEVLFWDYEEEKQLNKFLRIHIPQRILEILKNHNFDNKPLVNADKTKVEENDEELGWMDYHEMIADYMNESTQSLVRIAESMTWIGEQLNKKTEEINEINKKQSGRNEIKNFLIRTAATLNNFAKRIDPEIPIFYMNFEKGIDAMSNLLNISKSDFTVEQDEIDSAKKSLLSLIESISGSMDGVQFFIDEVIKFPRMSKELNSARQNVLNKLTELLRNMKICHSIAKELEKSLDE